jgi:hypothetical protein
LGCGAGDGLGTFSVHGIELLSAVLEQDAD